MKFCSITCSGRAHTKTQVPVNRVAQGEISHDQNLPSPWVVGVIIIDQPGYRLWKDDNFDLSLSRSSLPRLVNCYNTHYWHGRTYVFTLHAFKCEGSLLSSVQVNYSRLCFLGTYFQDKGKIWSWRIICIIPHHLTFVIHMIPKLLCSNPPN